MFILCLIGLGLGVILLSWVGVLVRRIRGCRLVLLGIFMLVMVVLSGGRLWGFLCSWTVILLVFRLVLLVFCLWLPLVWFLGLVLRLVVFALGYLTLSVLSLVLLLMVLRVFGRRFVMVVVRCCRVVLLLVVVLLLLIVLTFGLFWVRMVGVLILVSLLGVLRLVFGIFMLRMDVCRGRVVRRGVSWVVSLLVRLTVLLLVRFLIGLLDS